MVGAASSRITAAQQTFRALLAAMSCPGTVQPLPILPGEAPESLLLFALADHEVAFTMAIASESGNLSSDMQSAAHRLVALTGSTLASLPAADFVISFGRLPATAWSQLRRGTPAFPDRSATIIYIVPAVGNRLASSIATELVLTGPGIESDRHLVVSGLAASEFVALAELNAEFPLGVDVILADAQGRVACVPRSSKIAVCQPEPGEEAAPWPM